jgi:tRNA (cytidine/uridine-2'-O-)-methyltransferase
MHPQIAPNTGNIARLCVATGTELHLVRPLGFILSDRALRRSAMDYWPRLKLTVHDDADAFFTAMHDVRIWCFTSKGNRTHWEAEFQDGDCLLFGSETAGLPLAVTEPRRKWLLRVPQAPDERCLNLATSVGIGLYEALRSLQTNA